MWSVLPKFALFKIVFTLFSAILLLTLIMLFGKNDSEIGFNISSYIFIFKSISPVSILFILLIFFIGKWGWKLLWKAPYLGKLLNNNVCPDLNGKWIGQTQSNHRNTNGKEVVKDISVNIKADFFGFSITLQSNDGYQHSKAVLCGIHKDPRTGSFYITYIFEGYVPIPLDTDDRLFEGAAKLEVRFKDEGVSLEGTYWTNRAWQRNLNTAGSIKLTKNEH